MTIDNDGARVSCDGSAACDDGGASDAIPGINAPDGEESLRYQVEPGQSLSEAVIEAVAVCSDRAPVTPGPRRGDRNVLDPLYETIDPDALDSLFEPIGDEPRSQGTVAFTYCDHAVTVESEGVITVAKR